MKNKISYQWWMKDILKEEAFRNVLDNVWLEWCGHAQYVVDDFRWRLEYLKEDLAQLLRSPRYSKTCKLFMLAVTGARYLESVPGGLLMPDVRVFEASTGPMVTSYPEFRMNLDLGRYDDGTIEGVRRVIMAGGRCLEEWFERLRGADLERAVLALLVLRQSCRFAENAFEYGSYRIKRVISDIRDSAGNGALWYARPCCLPYECTYEDWYMADYTAVGRSPMSDEEFNAHVRQVIDMGCDPEQEGEYGLSYNDLEAVFPTKGDGWCSYFNPIPRPSDESVRRHFWYIVEWVETKVGLGHTPIYQSSRAKDGRQEGEISA